MRSIVLNSPSWYVLELSFGAPNDAASEYAVVTSSVEVRTMLESLEPEQLLAECVCIWVFQRGCVDQVLDLRRCIRVKLADIEVRADDELAVTGLFERAVPEVVVLGSEVEGWLPELQLPLLEEGGVAEVTNPKRMAALAREQKLDSQLTWRTSFVAGRHQAA